MKFFWIFILLTSVSFAQLDFGPTGGGGSSLDTLVVNGGMQIVYPYGANDSIFNVRRTGGVSLFKIGDGGFSFNQAQASSDRKISFTNTSNEGAFVFGGYGAAPILPTSAEATVFSASGGISHVASLKGVQWNVNSSNAAGARDFVISYSSSMVRALTVRGAGGGAGNVGFGGQANPSSRIDVTGGIIADTMRVRNNLTLTGADAEATIPTLLVDSLRRTIVVVDTAGYIISDSLKYKVIEHLEPVSFANASDVAARKHGTVIMYIVNNYNYVQNVVLASDSAASVTIGCVTATPTTYYQGVAFKRHTFTACVDNNPPFYNSAQGTGTSTTNLATFLPWKCMTNHYRMAWRYVGTYANHYVIRVEVSYSMPVANTSIMPIRVVNGTN